MRVEFHQVDWPFAAPFRISYRVQTTAETVLVELTDGNLTGRGEAMCVSYHGETIDSLLAQLAAVKGELSKGVSRAELQSLLPPGGARNGVDCALWDLEAKRAGRRAWELAGFQTVKPLTTAYTLSLDTPEAMGRAASAVRQYSLLKLKLTGEGDLERVTAVRKARPDVDIIVDANQAWNERHLRGFTPRLAELGVKLIEQPLPVGKDAVLAGFDSPVPLCADESCQTTESLPSLVGKYAYINIKLDKTGGLTEALRLARAAQEKHFQLMVGCMAGSSLSMAPAFIVGQLCSVIDLDGPLLSSIDVPNGIRYDGSRMSVPEKRLWG
jgi:L-alanine-DL-glutamate epimerase-like enolase superfamily enzyme